MVETGQDVQQLILTLATYTATVIVLQLLMELNAPSKVCESTLEMF